MSRKARVEGAVALVDSLYKPPSEAKHPDPVPGDNGAALLRIVAYFQAQHPEAWEAIRLCPTQHGVDEMAKLLDG